MKFQSKSDADTRKIGRQLGEVLKPGDVVCLFGDLGAGKTMMVKGIGSAFGIKERDITSASFVIIAEHDARIPFYHIDLYRVKKGEASDLGIHEYTESDGVSVIEWAERMEGELPDKIIKVKINYTDENSRDIEIEGIEL